MFSLTTVTRPAQYLPTPTVPMLRPSVVQLAIVAYPTVYASVMAQLAELWSCAEVWGYTDDMGCTVIQMCTDAAEG